MCDRITIADDFGVCPLTLGEVIRCDFSAVACTIHRKGGASEEITLTCRTDTLDEVDYFRHGGILHYVLRQLLAASEPAGSAD